MLDAERARYFTRNYESLQGLKWLPISIWLLLDAGWWRWYEIWQPISGVSTLILAFLLMWLIDVYYKRTFGRVATAPASQEQNVGLALLVAALFITGYVDGVLTPVVSVFSLTVAGLLLFHFWITFGLQAHRVAAVVVIAASSFLPLSGLVSYQQFSGTVLPVILAAAMFAFVGVVDHLLLVRTLKSVPNE